jgi:predicted nucleotidyltransferase
LGMILPKMGMKASLPSSSLADALFSVTQQRVLGLLFGQPERSFYASELIALAGGGSGAIQRELSRLEESGLISARRVGAQKHFQANRGSPIFEELASIARKTVGLAIPIRAALDPIKKRVRAAFVFGSVAKKRDTAKSDIDLMIISDKLAYADVYPLVEPLTARLGRQVNPTLYSREEFSRRLAEGSSFARRVMAQPKIWIIGNDRDFAA